MEQEGWALEQANQKIYTLKQIIEIMAKKLEAAEKRLRIIDLQKSTPVSDLEGLMP